MPSHNFTGIYAPPSGARFLLAARMAHEAYPVQSRTLIRWARRGMASPSLAGVGGWDMILSFEDLVSLRVVAALRAAKISWRDIRQAEQWLREETTYPRPFAREELWTFSSEVFTRFRGMLIAASRYGQVAMEIISEYLVPVSGLKFENHVATAWEARPLIVLDPKVQFGEPCIKGTRIPAQSVADMVKGGDPEPTVMQAYGITETEMHAALDWASRVAA